MGTSDLSIPLYNSMLLMVGSGDEIDMKRTEMDVYDYLYNEISRVPMHRITAGSTKEELRLSASDVDIFYYLTNHHGVWDSTDAKMYDSTTETVVLMEYQEYIPGTVSLRLINMHPSNDAISKLSCIRRNSHIYISSKLFFENAKPLYIGDEVDMHGPCQSNIIAGYEFEAAVGFISKEWPPCTKNWMARCRNFGWPEQQIFDNMVSSGCVCVPIGSKQSRHDSAPDVDLEWRLSFVQAEQILVRAMNHCQFLCYALLKVFLEEVLNTNRKKEDKLLCSYFLKTVMFWCIQTDSKYEWSKENFFQCFWKCYKVLLQWVYTGYCPNFFIPQNNLFVYRIVGADQERLFTQLYDLYCSGEQCLAQSSSLRTNIMKYIANPEKIATEVQFDEYTHDFVIYYAMNGINGLLNQEIGFDWKALYKVCRINYSSRSIIEQILITRHVHNVYNQVAFLEQSYCNCQTKCNRNKRTYEKHKKVALKLLKLTSKFGCATDPLYLALFMYLNGNCKDTLHILKQTKKRLYQDHVFYWNEFKNKTAYKEKMQGKPMSVKMKEAMCFDIQIQLHIVFCELDIEIDFLKKTRLRENLFISAFVFLEFLAFLCYHRLKSPLAEQSLQKLHSLVNTGDGRYILSCTKDIAWDILGICHHLSGNIPQALIAYCTSLKQTNFNYIDAAVKKRLALIGCKVS